MIIRRLDCFFRTHLTIDQPAFFNSLTNLALAPLQYLVGKNQFESLKGRVTYVPPKPAASPPYFASLCKVVRVIVALFLALFGTPIGFVSRYLSFCSSPTAIAYSNAYLLLLRPRERTPKVMEPAFAFLQKLSQEARNEQLTTLPNDLCLSFCSLPNHFDSMCAFLKEYNTRSQIDFLRKLPPIIQARYLSRSANEAFLNSFFDKISNDEYNKLHLPKETIELYEAHKKKQALDAALTQANASLQILLTKKTEDKVAEFRNDPLYNFPFYLAEQIQKHPKIIERADKALWQKYVNLRTQCQPLLQSNESDEALMERTKTGARGIVILAFATNARFITDLKRKLSLEASEIEEWIKEKRASPDYRYPFQMSPSLIEFMKKIRDPQTIQDIVKAANTCSTLLKEKGLEKYTSEKPDPNHAGVKALAEALDRLETISKLQELIKTQIA